MSFPQGVQTYTQTTYIEGCDINCNTTAGFAGTGFVVQSRGILPFYSDLFCFSCPLTAAVSAAAAADAVIVVVGIDNSIEHEARDR